MTEEKYVIVSNWDKVDGDEFYLSYKWDGEDKENIKRARALQKEGQLYYGYILPAISFAIYRQSDANAVLIDTEGDVVVNCESAVINCDDHWDYRTEYFY